MSPELQRLRDPSLLRTQAYIDGKWVNSRSGDTFSVHDPCTSDVIATMPEMAAEDTVSAIDAASNAFKTFRITTARERARMLHKWYDLIIQNTEDLATLITLENGKPLAEARSEVQYAADYVQWFSEEAPRIYGETIPASVPGRRVHTTHEPIGVCGLITPWNWPAGMVTRKIGPALAAGCTVVLKSPADTPFTSIALVVLAEPAGVPPGVINVITAHEKTSEVGKVLLTSTVVRKVSFTGSTRVGKILMEQAASTLKKLSFELGGNAPFIVFDDADIDNAVTWAVECKFRSSGQTCVCANRLYVQKEVYEKFTTEFTKQVKAFQLGSGFSDSTTHGPLISDRAMVKVKEHVENAIKMGATLLVGGHEVPELGPQFFELTVLGNMTSEMLLAHDETFGPVAGIFSFDTESEVIGMANDTEVGLAGYLCSQDITRCYRVAEALQVGMVGINTGLVSDVAMPFGGVKASGFGREGSKHGIMEYMTIKSVTVGGLET